MNNKKGIKKISILKIKLFHNDKSLKNNIIVYTKSIWLYPPLGFD